MRIGLNTNYLLKQRLESEDDAPECTECGEQYPSGRKRLGYSCCLVCGERAAKEVKHTIVPLPKSNYIYAHSAADVLSPYAHKGNR